MRPRPKPGFCLVARRELRWLLHDRVALILIFGVPLFAFVVLGLVFSHPVIRGLGVVVVDDDRSDTSRAFVEQVAAAPGLSIVARAGDLASASRSMRSGAAIAAVYIPADFERDLKAGRRPQVIAFYNQQFLTAAGIASQGMSDALAVAAGNAAPASRAAPAALQVGALVAETIVLVNPQRNYAQFLLRALLPMVIHAVIALAAGYSVGSEFRRRSMRAWLACAGGNPIVALAGKLAPLFAVFFLIMLAVPLVLEGLFEIPFKGDVIMMIAAGSLLVIGYLALAALLQLLVGDLATGLGITGLIVSPAFGYAGVGFPILGMNAFAEIWGALLPLRWYMAVLLGQAARGLPLHDSARPFAALAALAVIYSVFALLRLRAIARRTRRATAVPEPAATPATPRGIGGAFAAEWRRVLALRGAFILLFIAPLIYGLYYPQPYLSQILRKIPIAVVDNDLSELSRAIVQTLDASGAVSVALQSDTLAEARAALDRGEAFAVVGIPPGTRARRAQGHHRPSPDLRRCHLPVHLPIDGHRHRHSDQYLVLRARRRRRAHRRQPCQGIACGPEPGRHPAAADFQPGRRLRQLHRAGGLRADPAADPADRRRDADRRRAGAGERRRLRERTRPRHRAPDHLSARAGALLHRAAAHLRLLDARTSAATVRAGVIVLCWRRASWARPSGAWFKRPETPTLLLLATSLPQFFIAGFAWPREAIPARGPCVRARSSRPTPRSTASCASTSWAPASGRSRMTGAGSGAWRSAISSLAVISAHFVQGGGMASRKLA